MGRSSFAGSSSSMNYFFFSSPLPCSPLITPPRLLPAANSSRRSAARR
jgi:hypothetical protein